MSVDDALEFELLILVEDGEEASIGPAESSVSSREEVVVVMVVEPWVTKEDPKELVLMEEAASSEPTGEITDEPSSASVDLALVADEKAPTVEGEEAGE